MLETSTEKSVVSYLKVWSQLVLSGCEGDKTETVEMKMINLGREKRKKEIKRRALCVFPLVMRSVVVGSYLTRLSSALLSLSCLLHLLCQFDRLCWRLLAVLVLLTSPTSAQLIIMIVTLRYQISL